MHPLKYLTLLILISIHAPFINAQELTELARYPKKKERILAFDQIDGGWAAITLVEEQSGSYFLWKFDAQFNKQSRTALKIPVEKWNFTERVHFAGTGWYVLRQHLAYGRSTKGKSNKVQVTWVGVDGKASTKAIFTYAQDGIKNYIQKDHLKRLGFNDGSSGMSLLPSGLAPDQRTLVIGWVHNDELHITTATPGLADLKQEKVDLVPLIGSGGKVSYWGAAALHADGKGNRFVCVQQAGYDAFMKHYVIGLQSSGKPWVEKFEEKKYLYGVGAFHEREGKVFYLGYDHPMRGKESFNKRFRLYEISSTGMKQISERVTQLEWSNYNFAIQSHALKGTNWVATMSCQRTAGSGGSSSYNRVASIVIDNDKVGTIMESARRIYTNDRAGSVTVEMNGDKTEMLYGSFPNRKGAGGMGVDVIARGWRRDISKPGSEPQKSLIPESDGLSLGLARKKADGSWIYVCDGLMKMVIYQLASKK